MVYEEKIVGRYVAIRSITEEDAEFSIEIRQDKEKAKYFFHTVDTSIEKQLKWIKQQRET